MVRNGPGRRDCGPSLIASSGRTCTSTRSPSAPAATAALDMAATRSALPTAWLGSTITGRCVSCFRSGTALRSRVFRVSVSNVRIPTFAQYDLLVSLRHDIFGRHQKLFYSRAEAPFQNNRFIDIADLCEQPEILHVAGADLDDVRELADQHGVFWVHQFGYNLHPGFLAHVCKKLQPLFAQPWNA